MITVAKKIIGFRDGQSLIEFLLIFPVMIGLVYLLVQTNMVIQTSIVDQKYGRAQALFLTYNSPVYPELRFRKRANRTEMVVGVSDNIATPDYFPKATVVNVVRPGKDVGDDREGSEPNSRGKVRVRNSVSLCTQTNAPVSETANHSFCVGINDE